MHFFFPFILHNLFEYLFNNIITFSLFKLNYMYTSICLMFTDTGTSLSVIIIFYPLMVL